MRKTFNELRKNSVFMLFLLLCMCFVSVMTPVYAAEEDAREELLSVLAKADAVNEDFYSEETYARLEEAMLAGEALSEEASNDAFAEAADHIRAAMDGLEAKYPNLALGKNVTASSTYPTETFVTKHATDGDTQTRWGNAYKSAEYKGGDHEETLTVDLGAVYSVDMVSINWEAANASEFTLQGSLDGMEFFDIRDITTGKGEIEVLDNLGDVSVQYIRLALHEARSQYGYSIWELEVYEKNPNAKNYSNLALGKEVRVSGLEVSDGRFTAEMAVDGVVSADSRVSFAKDKDEQWMLIDLGQRKTVSKFVINFESLAPAFKIQVSTDGVNYKDVHQEQALDDFGPTAAVKEITIAPVKARYVKYIQLKRWTHTGNGRTYSGSIYEFEVYKNTLVDAKYVADSLDGQAPEISDGKLVLPDVPNGFSVSLYGSDNKQVVAMDGTVITPLCDMDVNILYKVENLNDAQDVAYSQKDINFVVPGQYEASESIHAKPQVLPGVREWKGNEGTFTLTSDSKIVVKQDALMETAKQIQFYLKDMIGKELEIAVSGEQKGDIVLIKDAAYASLGKEGYFMEIDDAVYIKSDSTTGVLYGGVTVTQILSNDEGYDQIPKGLIRDYPKYEVRAGMLDAARTYVPMDYLREISIYMAYYKMNEIHVHINDYWNKTKYTAFRLESDTYPEITAKDGSYSKEEYRQYQIDMKKYGIDVVTEIDTPAHADCFSKIDGAEMLSKGFLDIRKQSSYTIIENIIDEYLDGENPVIQSEKFHIGTDEYSKDYSEEMRAWTDHFIKYVNAKGYETRLWGSLGSRGFDGETEVSSEATMNIWAPYWADVKEMYAAGYDIINTCGGYLYIVPGANAGYPDRLDIATLYDIFEVYDFAPNRQYGNGTAIMPIAHPQTKGAEFALWNDMTSFGGGFSWFDIYDRLKAAVMIVSEKTWYGEKTEGQTVEEFLERVDTFGDRPAGANPGRVVPSKTELIAEVDFETAANGVAADSSGNGYDVELVNVAMEEGNSGKFVTLNGDGYLSMPFDAIGYPYTVMMDIKLSSDTAQNTEIFSGSDGVLYANMNGSGKLGYVRGNYQFTFAYEIPKDQWVTLVLTCDDTNAVLYVDGEKISEGINLGTAVDNRKDSSTFILPVEKILNHAAGSIDNLKLYNRVMTEDEIYADMDLAVFDNIALGKQITTSSTYPAETFIAAHAVDGNMETRWGNHYKSASYKAGNTEETVTVDLGKEYLLDKLVITFEAAYTSTFVIQGSIDGQEFFDIKAVTDGKEGENSIRNLNAKTRYIRLVLNNPATKYGYSIYEIEAYPSANYVLQEQTELLKDMLAETNIGVSNGCMLEANYQKYESMVQAAEALLEQDGVSKSDIHASIKELNAAIEGFAEDIIRGLLEILTQPVDAAARKGKEAVVTIEATGKDITYTWYYKNPGNWKFYESGSEFVSEGGTVYTMPMYAWRDGQEVYCVVTDAKGESIQSNTVTLTMDNGSIQIIRQPETVTVDAAGGEAVVKVEATGTDLTYQWYYKNPGNVKFYASGSDFVSEDGTEYTISVSKWRDGQEVYCEITDANGVSVQTNTITLSIAK